MQQEQVPALLIYAGTASTKPLTPSAFGGITGPAGLRRPRRRGHSGGHPADQVGLSGADVHARASMRGTRAVPTAPGDPPESSASRRPQLRVYTRPVIRPTTVRHLIQYDLSTDSLMDLAGRRILRLRGLNIRASAMRLSTDSRTGYGHARRLRRLGRNMVSSSRSGMAPRTSRCVLRGQISAFGPLGVGPADFVNALSNDHFLDQRGSQ